MNNNELNLIKYASSLVLDRPSATLVGEHDENAEKERRDIREARRKMEENLRNGRYSCGCGPTDGILVLMDINS